VARSGLLIAIDIGNSHWVVGLTHGRQTLGEWRMETKAERTADEYIALLKSIMTLDQAAREVDGVAITCVVPAMVPVAVELAQRLFHKEPLVVGPGVKTGLSLKVDQPREVGPDRIVNAVAGVDRVGFPMVVVDFGTAITFDVVDQGGNYRGGAIAPGIGLSAKALFQGAARLSAVELTPPPSAIGHNTVDAIRSGLLLGYAGLIEGLLARIQAELGVDKLPVIATGGWGATLAPLCPAIDLYDPHLTLTGLVLIWHRHFGLPLPETSEV